LGRFEGRPSIVPNNAFGLSKSASKKVKVSSGLANDSPNRPASMIVDDLIPNTPGKTLLYR
jgi:hypothetical protein